MKEATCHVHLHSTVLEPAVVVYNDLRAAVGLVENFAGESYIMHQQSCHPGQYNYSRHYFSQFPKVGKFAIFNFRNL